MLDYIKEFGHVSFEERAFSEIDALVLTELEYLPLEKKSFQAMKTAKPLSQ